MEGGRIGTFGDAAAMQACGGRGVAPTDALPNLRRWCIAGDRGGPAIRLALSLPNRDRSMYSCTKRGGREMAQINVKVNGRAVSRQVEDRTLLVEFLRETLGLTGTHVGCDTGQCGACVVHLDGRAIKSCTMMAAQASGAEITTIEGLAKGDELHPMQAAFHQHHALQCGFCTPGMIMTAVDLLRRIPHQDEATIR